MPDVIKWDHRFLKLAEEVAHWSKDPRTGAGAVIVRSDRTVCSLGYNGFPSRMPDRRDWYENRDEKMSRIVHAEMNALLFARERVVGYTLYTWPFLPCERCFVHMAQAGMTRYVAPIPPPTSLANWGAAFEKVRRYATEMRVEIVELP